jgi:CcmD family protein
MENAGYLFAAFSVIWALVFGYVFYLLNRQRGLRREINLLKEALKEKGAGQ